MKKQRSILIAFLVVIALTVSVFATTRTKTATLNYANIKITLDGKEIVPKDVAGNIVEPFTIDGTTYLPVRAISNALGLDVDWDGSTNTVILKTKGTDQATPPAAPTKPTGEPTLGQKNALESAKKYLKISAFSYSGLIEQLEFEKYSHDDAVWAADNCGADWNEQAAKSAAQYIKVSSFSRDGLIEQLEYVGFTHEQAVYGVTAVGY